MKKSTLAILILGLVAAQASQAAEVYNKNGNKLDLYGRVKAYHDMTSDKKQDGDRSYVRFGFKGETQINDQLTGFGQWEYQIAANKAEGDTDTAKTRLGFAGLKAGDYGSFDYGRNYGILYSVAGYTDVLPEFGGDALVKTDNYMTGRTTGVATYRNNNFFGLVDGLKLGLQYQGKNSNRSDITKENGDGFGTALSYDIGDTGLTLGAAYANSNRTELQKKAFYGQGDGKAEAWTTGMKYSQNNIYLAALYGEARHMTPVKTGSANKNQIMELVAQYQFDFGLRPSLAYIQSKGKDINGLGDVDLVKYIDVAATYYFNKNMSTFVDYKINRLKSDNALGLNSDNVVALGLVYQF